MVTVSGKLVPSVVPSEELAPNVITVATGSGFVLILIAVSYTHLTLPTKA